MKMHEIVESVLEILRDAAEDPAEELIKHGKALQQIGEALRGRSLKEAYGIIKASQTLFETAEPKRDKSKEGTE